MPNVSYCQGLNNYQYKASANDMVVILPEKGYCTEKCGVTLVSFGVALDAGKKWLR